MTIVCIHSMLHLYGGVNTSFFVVVGVVVVVVVVEYIAMHKQPHSDWVFYSELEFLSYCYKQILKK